MSIINSDDFKIIYKTEKYILGNVWENVYLYCKETGEVNDMPNFYGDPTCGVIYGDGDWCAAGGD